MAGRDLARIRSMFGVAAVRRYARLPIPSDEDVLAEEFIREWDNGASDSREAADALDSLSRGILLNFVVRASSWAVRDRKRRHAALALRSLCIAGTDSDPRDLQEFVCVIHDSMRKLGMDPVPELRKAAARSSGGAEVILRGFGSPEWGEVSLAKYRVRESEDADGFRYELGLSESA